MSYISAFLWFLLLLLSTTAAIMNALLEPVYFPAARSLFPTWPVWSPYRTVILLTGTAIILFLPKLFSGFLITIKGRGKEFGGFHKLVLSILGEVLLSALLAPIRMMFHTKFVLTTLMGRPSGWGRQQRDDLGTSWGEAFRFHWGGTVFALIWGGIIYLLNPGFFWWLTPIIIPLLLAIPLSVWTSRASSGRLLRRFGFFLTPEEIVPPRELLETAAWEKIFTDEPSAMGIPKGQGFKKAVLDPVVNALHQALLGCYSRNGKTLLESKDRELVERILVRGPGDLSPREKKRMLYDRHCLAELHHSVRELPADELRAHWGLPAGEICAGEVGQCDR